MGGTGDKLPSVHDSSLLVTGSAPCAVEGWPGDCGGGVEICLLLIDIMDTLFFTNKGRLMDAVESFFIFRETKPDNQLNDKLTVKQNIIFETVVREDPHRGIYDACSPHQQIPSQSDLSAP